ncbi:MAG: glycosyltransferase family 1 protein [Patescibacteria group bacterium]
MRIGIDLRCLQDRFLTGVGEYAWRILQAWPQTDKSFRLVGYVNAAGAVNLPPELESRLTLKRTNIPNKLNNFLLYYGWGQTMDVWLSQAHKPVQALWFPNPGFIHWNHKVPAILTLHDLSFIQWPRFFSTRGHIWYFPAVKKLLANTVKTGLRVACVSEHTAADLKTFVPNINPANIKVIYPGVEHKYFAPVTPAALISFKQRLNLPAPYMLSLGTIEPRKNYQLLIRAYQKILESDKNFPYDLVMAGSWGWKTGPLKKLIANFKYPNRLRILGYVAAADKPLLYAGADLFLYPSFYEGFGMPVLEAMAAGVPVITSLTSSLPEVVGEAGVMLSPYLLNHWVEAIKWLANDKASRLQYSSIGRARARRFSWEQSAIQYRDWLLDLTHTPEGHNYKPVDGWPSMRPARHMPRLIKKRLFGVTSFCLKVSLALGQALAGGGFAPQNHAPQDATAVRPWSFTSRL